jgi:hypothetical protein
MSPMIRLWLVTQIVAYVLFLAAFGFVVDRHLRSGFGPSWVLIPVGAGAAFALVLLRDAIRMLTGRKPGAKD